MADERAPEPDRFVQTAVDVYKECCQIPSISSAKICPLSADKVQGSAGCITITSHWSQRDIEQTQNRKFLRTHFVTYDKSSKSVGDVKESSFPVELQNMQLNAVSPSGKFQAVVRKVSGAKKEENKQFIEVWSSNNLVKSVDINSMDKHGKIYEDSQFGCLEWSPSEKYLLYVAEKKIPKTASYFERTSSEESSGSKPAAQKGSQYDYQDDWGEQLVSKLIPVLVIFDVVSEEIKVLDGIPDSISAGQATWCAGDKGVVFVGWHHEPYRLGLIYCTQRKSAVFHLSLEDSVLERLSVEDSSVHSPRFDRLKEKLVYAAGDVGGPHHSCSRLMLFDWESKSTSILVDIVKVPDQSGFPGIYTVLLQERCWTSDGTKVILSTVWRSSKHIIVVDVNSKSVTQLTKDVGCWSVLDVTDDVILASYSSPNSPPRLLLAVLPDDVLASTLSWTIIAQQAQEEKFKHSITWEVMTLSPKDSKGREQEYESILMKPVQVNGGKKPPLLVYPHGGPHSVFLADFMLYPVGLCKLGYALLLVNYRGSIGFGQKSLMSLPGNIGTQDVLDVQLAATTVIEQGQVDANNIFVIGGSHGGFLAAHVIGQYPDFYRACTLRNPVINVVTMVGGTDIPDWTYFESGFAGFHFDVELTAETCKEMLRMSPISHVSKVKTPTLIMIGENDRRVIPSQGKEFYKALKARGVEVRMLVYPDNAHPINTVEAESDAFVNIARWFHGHRVDT